MRPMLVFALVALLACGALAQPAIFSELPLERALEESKRSNRVLVVYLRGEGEAFERMDETTWRSPTLRDWMLWHGTAVRVDMDTDREEFMKLREMVLPCIPPTCEYDPAEKPVVVIFRNGRLERLIPDFRFQAYVGEKNPVYNRFSTPPDITKFYPKTLTMLYALDVYMDKLRATQPAWMALHDERNPAPPRPDGPPAAYPVRDEHAAAFSEGDGDVLRVLAEAREQVAYGALYDATGAYSWLWEAGAAKDPALVALRNTVVADEIGAMCGRRDGSRQRFLRVRDNMLALQPWWTYMDLYEWMIVSRAAGDAGSVVEFFHLFLNDEQEATIVGHADRAAYALLVGEGGPTGTPMSTPELAAWVEKQGSLLAAPPPSGLTPDEWKKVQALRRRVVLDNACRAYVGFLVMKDDAAAEAVAAGLLRVMDDGVARVTLVACAAAAGEVRAERHGVLLAEAASKGEDRPALRERVRTENQ